MSLPIVYIPKVHKNNTGFVSRLDHVHLIETGECLKDRSGDCPIQALTNRDPFYYSRTLDPTTKQNEFVGALSVLVDLYLKNWGRQSGKTTARLMLAKAIIDGDNNG